MARVDVSILREIARVVQSRSKVPERIQVQNRTFLITYLDDHKQRIEEALRRHDPDRLNMLFGQLESKVKYQVVRRSSSAAQKSKPARSARSTSRSKTSTSAKKRSAGGRPKKRPAAAKKKAPPKKAPSKSAAKARKPTGKSGRASRSKTSRKR